MSGPSGKDEFNDQKKWVREREERQMEHKVQYEDVMAAEDLKEKKNLSVWAVRCNVRAYNTAVPYLMCPCFPVIQLQLYASQRDRLMF